MEKFTESWAKVFAEYGDNISGLPKAKKDIYDEMGLNKAVEKELENVCSTAALIDEAEKDDNPNRYALSNIPPDDYGLATVKQKIDFHDEKFYEQMRGRHRYNINALKLDQEIQFLGRQKLTMLRNSIVCIAELNVAGDFSDNPDAPKDIRSKDIYHSAFFFFDNTFYNDLRKSSSTEYSDKVIEWAKRYNIIPVNELKQESMDDVTFSDINLEVGQPYLFQHQGNCEHILVVGDIRSVTIYGPQGTLNATPRFFFRLLNPNTDSQNLSHYPTMLYKSRRKRTVCRGCQLNTAKWSVHNSRLCPESPCLMCDSCMRLLHYDSNGKKVDPNFELYVYMDRTAL